MNTPAPQFEEHFVNGSVWQLFKGANPYTFTDTYKVLRNLFGYELNYVNYGYWPEGIETNEPGRKLTHLLVDKLNPKPGQRLIEAGSGLGQAAVDSCEHYDLDTVFGMNMCEPQVAFANALSASMGLQDKVIHKVCNACEEVKLFEPGSFDHAFAQECIGHFPDPLSYLKGVRRLLTPGGRMAITVVTSPKPPGRGLAFAENLFFGCVPENASYWSELFKEAGFINVESQDITDVVFTPLFKAVRKKIIENPESIQFQGPIGKLALKFLLTQSEKGIANQTMGYQIIVGETPMIKQNEESH